jgi:hypothetical protein
MQFPALPGRLNTPAAKTLIIIGSVLSSALVLCCGVGTVATVFGPKAKPSVSTSTTAPGRAVEAAHPGVATYTSADPTTSSAAATQTPTAATPSTSKATTKPAPPPPPPPSTQRCDPNYSGACVPIASDVDCAGGSGNGPAYVRGPVYVIGRDIYDLDSDNDGVGCEN